MFGCAFDYQVKKRCSERQRRYRTSRDLAHKGRSCILKKISTGRPLIRGFSLVVIETTIPRLYGAWTCAHVIYEDVPFD